MFNFLKDHPFAVEAFFESSLVLTFAVPKEQLKHLLPAHLELDTFQDEWGFIAAAMVQTKDLRPKGFPRFMGNDFFLIGYRIFVRYRTKVGKNLRGLYILGSQTDQKKMEIMGNIFTHYKYTTTDIQKIENGSLTKLFSEKSDFSVQVDLTNENVPLPDQSPFADWKEARRFAGPLPFTFTVNEPKKEILIIEGVRENWTPQPVKVIAQHFSFIEALKLEGVILANAFVLEDIPYYWKKGKKERWEE